METDAKELAGIGEAYFSRY